MSFQWTFYFTLCKAVKVLSTSGDRSMTGSEGNIYNNKNRFNPTPEGKYIDLLLFNSKTKKLA